MFPLLYFFTIFYKSFIKLVEIYTGFVKIMRDPLKVYQTFTLKVYNSRPLQLRNIGIKALKQPIRYIMSHNKHQIS